MRLSVSSKFGGYCFLLLKCGENLISLEGQYKSPFPIKYLLFGWVKNLIRERSLSTTTTPKNNSKVQMVSKGRSPLTISSQDLFSSLVGKLELRAIRWILSHVTAKGVSREMHWQDLERKFSRGSRGMSNEEFYYILF